MGSVIAFAGPCLPRTPDVHWQDLIGSVEVWPPAERGDVLVACAERPHTIVLLDGYYYTVPAVTHKELLYALDAGIRVIGAASMGALRAAELERFGMEGVGHIFRWFRAGALDGDDEVALLHAPAELGYAPLTIALVELRDAVRSPRVRAHADRAARSRFIEAVKSLPFGERSQQITFDLAERMLGPAARNELELALGSNSIKTRDARLALESALESPATPSRRVEPLVTGYVSSFREWYLRLPPYERTGSSRRTFQRAWNVAQVLHPSAPDFVQWVRTRFLVASAGLRAGLRPAGRQVDELERTLAGHLKRSIHGAALPVHEVLQEAEDHALAQEALSHFGSVEAAFRALLVDLGVEDQTETSRLLDLIQIQDDLMPSWLLVRAFAFSSLLDPAIELADCAADIIRLFRETNDGARVAKRETDGFAQALWDCDEPDIHFEATRRGLYRSHGAHDFSPGLHGTLERLVVAESLDRADSPYARLRDRLIGAPIEHALTLAELSQVGG